MRLLRQEQDLLQTKITDFLTLSCSSQLVESLPSYIPDWNLKKAPLSDGASPFWPLYKECPLDLQLVYTLHTCTLEKPMLVNSCRAFHTRVYVSCFRTKRITRRPHFDPVRFKKRRNLNSRTCNYLSHFLRLINVFRWKIPVPSSVITSPCRQFENICLNTAEKIFMTCYIQVLMPV